VGGKPARKHVISKGQVRIVPYAQAELTGDHYKFPDHRIRIVKTERAIPWLRAKPLQGGKGQ